MKEENKKILKKAVKTCKDCGNDYLLICLSAHKYDNEKEVSLDIDYVMDCGKCPGCRSKCWKLHRGEMVDGHLVLYVDLNECDFNVHVCNLYFDTFFEDLDMLRDRHSKMINIIDLFRK